MVEFGLAYEASGRSAEVRLRPAPACSCAAGNRPAELTVTWARACARCAEAITRLWFWASVCRASWFSCASSNRVHQSPLTALSSGAPAWKGADDCHTAACRCRAFYNRARWRSRPGPAPRTARWWKMPACAKGAWSGSSWSGLLHRAGAGGGLLGLLHGDLVAIGQRVGRVDHQLVGDGDAAQDFKLVAQVMAEHHGFQLDLAVGADGGHARALGAE